MKKGLMVALAAIAVTVSVQGTGNSKSGEDRSQ